MSDAAFELHGRKRFLGGFEAWSESGGGNGDSSAGDLAERRSAGVLGGHASCLSRIVANCTEKNRRWSKAETARPRARAEHAFTDDSPPSLSRVASENFFPKWRQAFSSRPDR